jgi:hypothetical protein
VSDPPDITRSITDVVRLRAGEIMALPGVVGLGEGRLPDGRTCVRIFLAREDRALRAQLPRTLDGYPVDVEVTGEIRALPDDSTESTP